MDCWIGNERCDFRALLVVSHLAAAKASTGGALTWPRVRRPPSTPRLTCSPLPPPVSLKSNCTKFLECFEHLLQYYPIVSSQELFPRNGTFEGMARQQCSVNRSTSIGTHFYLICHGVQFLSWRVFSINLIWMTC